MGDTLKEDVLVEEDVLNEENNTNVEEQKETKADKFIRIAEQRVNKAIDAIDKMEGLSNRSSYEYTDEQVQAMFGALEKKLADVKTKFQKKEQKTVFSFNNQN